jgi:hypothetical protein
MQPKSTALLVLMIIMTLMFEICNFLHNLTAIKNKIWHKDLWVIRWRLENLQDKMSWLKYAKSRRINGQGQSRINYEHSTYVKHHKIGYGVDFQELISGRKHYLDCIHSYKLYIRLTFVQSSCHISPSKNAVQFRPRSHPIRKTNFY